MSTIVFTSVAAAWWLLSALYVAVVLIDIKSGPREAGVAASVTFLCGCAAWALR